jgi:hypothetical protein
MLNLFCIAYIVRSILPSWLFYPGNCFCSIAAVPLAFIGGDYGQLLFTNVSRCIVVSSNLRFFFKNVADKDLKPLI